MSLDPFQIVAIDGGAASGKTTLCLRVARTLGYGYLNTGAFYRCLALACLRGNCPPGDAGRVLSIAEALDVCLRGNPDSPAVFMGNEDVTQRIREPDVTALVSIIASDPSVRSRVIRLQREAAQVMAGELGGIVADGRDSTTVLFPKAAVKLLLVASEQAKRARSRRSALSFQQEVLERDRVDNQATGFLTAGPGVLVRESLEDSVDALVAEIVGLVEEARTSRHSAAE